jgi:hypothetical protein
MTQNIGTFKSGSTWTFTVQVAESVLVGGSVKQTIRNIAGVVLLTNTGTVLSGTQARIVFSAASTSAVCAQKCKTDLKFTLASGEIRHTETFEFTVLAPETP